MTDRTNGIFRQARLEDVETEDEELPADYICPLCGAGASDFQKID